MQRKCVNKGSDGELLTPKQVTTDAHWMNSSSTLEMHEVLTKGGVVIGRSEDMGSIGCDGLGQV